MAGTTQRDNPSDGLNDVFDPADLGASDDAPPAYGEQHDQLHLSQAGFSAGAAVTDDGRVNINISEKNHRLAELLAPTLRRQLAPPTGPTGPLPPPYIPPSLGGQPGQTPPPKLNVVIQIVGSRGDVQPFVALGKVLKDTYGHRVRLATHTTFQKFVEDNGLEFFNIGGDPAELMAFMVKNPGLMPGIDALKSGEITKRRQGIEQIVLGCWRSCIEAGDGLGPAPPRHKPDEPIDESYTLPGSGADRPFVADAIIANPPSFAHIHVAEKLGIPLHMMFTMPWSPTRAFPHPLANIESSNTDVVMTNYVSYALVEMMTWQGLGDVINRFRTKILDLDPLSLIWAPGLLNRLRVPTTYCWSPALIPKPADWANEITISGFYFLNLASAYTPEPELAEFLAAGPPPVYIGFGSIVVDDPNALTRMIFDAVSITGVRALVSKGWGGLGADSVGIPDGVFMLGNCPHDWLFKHVSAVVHHGGAGTSAAGINLGKPTVVVPFFGDQPFWGAMIAKAGAGPAPIPYKKLTSESLAGAIQEALKPETQARAQELGAKIREERGADVGGKSFHEFLDLGEMRCSLAPSRAAVWRVRRSQVRLSALAGAVLVQEGVLKYSDMKLHRSIEYNTEDQPWDPISAVTSSLVGDIGSMTMAVADFPRELFKQGKKKSGPQSGTAASEAPAQESGSAADEATSMTTSGALASTSTSNLLGQQSETGSVLSPQPSVLMSPAEPASRTSTNTIETEPSSALSPQNTQSSTKSPSRPAADRRDSSPPPPITYDTAVDTGKSVSRIVGAGMKSPVNFCMGLAKGFRNAPKLYNDDTVRPQEKVTGLASGLKLAGKEFGFGMYDGISGLVTQPLRGAEKEGGMGLLKGFGKGIGGLIFKPAGAFWALPAYAMQGVHAEVRSKFSRSSLNYIITSRVVQGQTDLESSNAEEREDILLRWRARRDDLKGYYLLKQKERRSAENQEASTSQDDLSDMATPPKTGWVHTRHLSIDERRKLQAQKEAWSRRQAELRNDGSGSGSANEDEEFERAILASVQQTSRGNKEEDARVEQAIRASVKEMRRIADQSRDWKAAVPDDNEGGQSDAAAAVVAASGAEEDEDWNITDQEYQALIEEAVRQSMAHPPSTAVARGHDGDGDGDGDHRGVEGEEDDEELRRALLESQRFEQQGRSASGEHDDVDEEEQLHRAMEESEKAHREQMERHNTEEEKVMEYAKQQSLAEEEHRRSRAKGKGVAPEDDDEQDEDLRKALEESLKMSGHGDSGPSVS